mmetsp:Transcript_24749/g.69644  ORF Transcript_24749/g.69644 Transcript_24749/m.69644 type:complete len:202 (+) Transcript_24749:515-1120(+)
MTTEWRGMAPARGAALTPHAFSRVDWRSSASAPSRIRWMGSKTTPSSWRFWSSTSAKRAGWRSSSTPPLAFRLSQHDLAVASEWFPSPMRITAGSRPAAFAASVSLLASAFRVFATCSVPAAVARNPFTPPAPLNRPHSYSGSLRPPPAKSGSMTVLPGSSMIMMMCGNSSGAPWRIAMRGGRRATMVFSVGRIIVGLGQL